MAKSNVAGFEYQRERNVASQVFVDGRAQAGACAGVKIQGSTQCSTG